MNGIQAVVLGLVQGLTEFLPVSSSGHLILVPQFFHWPDQGQAFDTILHLGTLLALFWFFRKDLLRVFSGFFAKNKEERTSSRRLVAQITVATIPSLAVGYVLHSILAQYDRLAWLVALDLALWGIVLGWADRRARSTGEATLADFKELTWKQAFIIGGAQVFALLPGTSRSGMTITAGLFTGLSRSQAARFSFLLAIPVTAAAGLYGLLQWVQEPMASEGVGPLFLGFVVAFISGAWAIRFLLRFVSQRSYVPFVLYRVALALVVLFVLVR